MTIRSTILAAVFLLASARLAFAAEPMTSPPEVRHGTVRYEPPADETGIPDRFRLDAQTFNYEESPYPEISREIAASLVTFPSPVETPYERNNTVHCEYYRPLKEGKVPAVVVLHILGGDFPLSRIFCNTLAHRGVAALFVKMPYYGPRREPVGGRRMVSLDPRETVEGMTQAILDIRFAVAWLASRDEVDPAQLGIFGISLGGITGALASTAEPRLKNVCLMLAGGDMATIGAESRSRELAEARRRWKANGQDEAEFDELIKSIDPVTYAANARDRRILMINATDDEVIPKVCTLALWQALGRPEIQWYSGGHYSIARHFFKVLNASTRFFAVDGEGAR